MDQVWYHGTTSDTWVEIQKDGMLWGKRGTPSRCTYLARDFEEAAQYGNVVLRVTYTPMLGQDNFEPGCWQMRVYAAIPLWDVELVGPDEVSGLHRTPLEQE